MGNQSSKSASRRNDEAHVQQVLDQWPQSEQVLLQLPFANGDPTLTTTTLQDHCSVRLSVDFDGVLARAFSAYVGALGERGAGRVSLGEYVDAVHVLCHGTATERSVDAFARLFMKSTVQPGGPSLAAFVDAVVRTGIRLWLRGSIMSDDRCNAKAAEATIAWMNASDDACKRLARTFLASPSHSNATDDADLAFLHLDDDNTATNKDQSGANEPWTTWTCAEPYPSTNESQQALVAWLDGTPGLLTLLRVAARGYFLGNDVPKDTEDALHRLRVAHLVAPRLQRVEHAGTPPPPSLMSAPALFFLTLSMPALSLSWSTTEQAQRRMARPLCYERVFSSRADGKSWQVFCHQLIRHPGATLTIVKTKQGAVFGGYADVPWQLDTDWYGTQANFLFKLAGGAADAAQNDHFGTWLATSINNHYQYLCSGKKSLPNGFGMGGQFDYAGLWINDDFAHGHSRGGPLCSTYQSPRLCQEDPFDIDEVEVWLVCPAVQDEEGMEPGSSVLDRAEDMEFLEMSGKKLYSKDLGKPKTEEEDESEHGR